MNRLKRIAAFFFFVGGLCFAWVAMSMFLDMIEDSFSEVSHLFAFVLICLIALGLGWGGYWLVSSDLKKIMGPQQWPSSGHRPRKKSQPLALVIAYVSAPFVFLYLGGWRVFLPIAIAGIGTDLFASAVNQENAGLSEFMLGHWQNVPFGWFRILGLVYFQYAFCYLHMYNKRVEEGRDVKEIQDFKWGWYVCVSLSYGIALVYTGVPVFVSTLTWSGSFLKAITLSICSLYLAHKVMSWLQRRLKGYLIRKYAFSQEEFSEYQPFKYPRFIV